MNKPLYKDPSAPIEARVRDLLARMTPEEKAEQLCQDTIGRDPNPDNHGVGRDFNPLVGSVYQYLLLKIMVNLVFAGIEGVPEYRFDFPVFFLTLAVFILVYEGIMFACGRAMKQIPLKQIMSE